MKNLILAIFLFVLTILSVASAESYNVDEVRVYKSKNRMQMLYKGEITKEYYVMLGKGGYKPKEREGDNRVPEGTYTLDFKNAYSKFFRSIQISYPNEADILRAQEGGYDPGGEIFIHGKPRFGKKLKGNWTRGCIALENWQMKEIWENVEVPTPITIFP